MILFDFSQIIHNNLYSFKEQMIAEGLETTFGFLKHRTISMILSISNKYRDEREIVLCADDRNTWRKDVHPYYKGRRKLRRKTDSFPWDEFYEHLNKFEEELKENFPFNFIKINKAEGDDVIGSLVYYINKTKPSEKIIIVSNDKDFKQLHFSSMIKQYDPKEKVEINTLNPKNELMWLILNGDSNDDVLNVKTTDADTLVNPDKRQITMWKEEKVWQHICNNTVMDELLVDVKDSKTKKIKVSREQLLENFKRNQKLVDLSKVPVDIQKEIIYKYEENKERIPEMSKMNLMQFFIKNRMVVLSDKINDFDKYYDFNKVVKGGLDAFLD